MSSKDASAISSTRSDPMGQEKEEEQDMTFPVAHDATILTSAAPFSEKEREVTTIPAQPSLSRSKHEQHLDEPKAPIAVADDATLCQITEGTSAAQTILFSTGDAVFSEVSAEEGPANLTKNHDTNIWSEQQSQSNTSLLTPLDLDADASSQIVLPSAAPSQPRGAFHAANQPAILMTSHVLEADDEPITKIIPSPDALDDEFMAEDINTDDYWNDVFRKGVSFVIKERNEWERTLQEYRAMRSADDKDPYVYYKFGCLYHIKLQNFHRADFSYRQATTLDPKFAAAHLYYARLLGLQKYEYTAADEHFKTALELEPECADTHAWYGVYCLQRASDSEQLVTDLKAEAISHLQRALELDPNHNIAHRTLAKLALMPPINLVEAHKHLAAALVSGENLAETHLALANFLEEHLLQYEAAVHHYRESIKDCPSQAKVYLRLYTLLAEHFPTLQHVAEDCLREIVRLEPSSCDARVQLADHIAARLHDYSRAERQYDKAIRLDPKSAKAHNNFAAFYEVYMKDSESALRHYTEAVKLDDAYVVAHLNLGLLRQKLGRFDDAKAAYEKALSVAPEDVLARLRLAALLSNSLNDREAAKAVYSLVLVDKPTNLDALLNLAALMAKDGPGCDFSQAQRLLLKAIHLHPLNPVARCNLGLLLQYNTPRAWSLAVVQYLCALSLDPTDEYAQEQFMETFHDQMLEQDSDFAQFVIRQASRLKVHTVRFWLHLARCSSRFCPSEQSVRSRLLHKALLVDPQCHEAKDLLAALA